MVFFRSIFCLLHQSLHHGFGFQSSFLESRESGPVEGMRYHELPHLLRAHGVATKNTGKSWDLPGNFLIGNDGREGDFPWKRTNSFWWQSSLSCTRFWSFTCISWVWTKPPLLFQVQDSDGKRKKNPEDSAPSSLCSSLTRPLLSVSVPPAATNMPSTPWTPSYVCPPEEYW